MVRAFVALELPGEIRERLTAAQTALRGCTARLNFVEPALIHITLKFLGEVGERDLPRVMDTLKSIRFTPFPITVGTVTVNNPSRPHTVWCSIDDHGQGKILFSLVEDALEPLGYQREARGFTPHATLARVKVPDASLLPAIRSLAGKTYGECRITGMKLKKSTLTPRGPVYEDLLEVPW
jgi:RNA 2',3'-cyclic 3'-phosphodiesterase